jgi:hypothetical protein
MVSGMRDQVLALACVRHGLPPREGRGIDALPLDVTVPLQDTLVRSLDALELQRAFRAVTDALVREIHTVDRELAVRLGRALYDLTEGA